ncbi:MULTISPECIES: DUF6227 family protein [Streptomyces]|uniref:DUF6227 family protein n=1 Tax=Streptomyces lichenis TaxID=2306967 RepID=A0ABT0ICQ3_9ACTN|nr:DUF6227 family protein [Streptomyces lichenis]MCK8679107.1 DUF6227 family protein [Streptomyces lichenis]
MNVPDEQYETTETHVERLLGRALNSFDLPDFLVDRLDSALAHASSLHSCVHSGPRHRLTHRHTYLLADGSSLTLWELVHNTGRDARDQHELYADETELRLAASRLPDGFGAWPHPAGLSLDLDTLEVPQDSVAVYGRPAVAPWTCEPDGAADHARRVLRRAENADRPGERTAARLRGAFAYHIRQVFGRQCGPADRYIGFTLYEHAFLLLDGSETSLWEVEHTATPDGRHMCEVYEHERAAREAMEHRARVR